MWKKSTNLHFLWIKEEEKNKKEKPCSTYYTLVVGKILWVKNRDSLILVKINAIIIIIILNPGGLPAN